MGELVANRFFFVLWSGVRKLLEPTVSQEPQNEATITLSIFFSSSSSSFNRFVKRSTIPAALIRMKKKIIRHHKHSG